MIRYLINCDVTSAEGTQTYYVDAASEKEALEKFKADGGEFYCEEIEVQDIGKPQIIGTTDLDDFGDGIAPKVEAEQQAEPVAYMDRIGTHFKSVHLAPKGELPSWMKRMTPLYAHPPAQPQLSDEEISKLWDAQRQYHGGEPCKIGHLEFARSVLAAQGKDGAA